MDDEWDKVEQAPPPADEVAAGTVIAGKYRLDAPLGSGGMGTVWSCTHVGLGERMAIKLVSTSTRLSAEVRTRFVREARSSARLKSRFTVRVFDTGELPLGTPYIVMEYLEGVTLSQHLRRVGHLSLAETVRILSHVGRGLERAHEAGIVHRDIKPENVFLAHTPDDGVIAKVFDFGVAKLSEGVDVANGTETVRGTFVGTPQFMSPEQAMGLVDVDHRADVYSMGVLAHRMLTGKRLFNAESMPALLMKICSEDLPKLAAAWPEAPPAVEAWFQRTCAREREQRYPTAAACIEGLVAAAGIVPDGYTPAGSRVPQTALGDRSGSFQVSEPPTGPRLGPSSVTPVSGERATLSPGTLAGALAGTVADGRSSVAPPRGGRRVPALLALILAGAVVAMLLLIGRGPRSTPSSATSAPPTPEDSVPLAATASPSATGDSPLASASTAPPAATPTRPDAATAATNGPALARPSSPARPAPAPATPTPVAPAGAPSTRRPDAPPAGPAPSKDNGVITDVGY